MRTWGVRELQGLQLLKLFTAADTPPASPGKPSVESFRDAAVLVDFTILNIGATTVMVTDTANAPFEEPEWGREPPLTHPAQGSVAPSPLGPGPEGEASIAWAPAMLLELLAPGLRPPSLELGRVNDADERPLPLPALMQLGRRPGTSSSPESLPT